MFIVSLTRRFKKAGRAAQFVTKVQKLIAVKNKKLDTNGRYSELSESTQFEGKEDMNKSLDYVKVFYFLFLFFVFTHLSDL